MTDIIKEWTERCIDLNLDEELFIPAIDQKEAKRTTRLLREQFRRYSAVDSTVASQLFAINTFRDGKVWIKVSRTAQLPNVGYKKNINTGKIEKLVAEPTTDRRRQILLMIQDGLNIEQISDLLSPPLNEEELNEFF